MKEILTRGAEEEVPKESGKPPSRGHAHIKPSNFPSPEAIDRIEEGSGGLRKKASKIREVIRRVHPHDQELFFLIKHYPDPKVAVILSGIYADRHTAEWNSKTVPLGDEIEVFQTADRKRVAQRFMQQSSFPKRGAGLESVGDIVEHGGSHPGIRPWKSKRVEDMWKAIDVILKGDGA